MSFNRMVLFQKKSILYPVLSSVKKKYSRRKSNLLPLASTLLLYTLLATNRPAITCRTGVARVDRTTKPLLVVLEP